MDLQETLTWKRLTCVVNRHCFQLLCVDGRRNPQAAPMGGAVLRIENHSVVCLKCGISRPTLRKWLRRYREQGMEGLSSGSRRPKSSPAVKILGRRREWIRELRKRRLGSRRIQNELKRVHDFTVSRTTIKRPCGRRTRSPYRGHAVRAKAVLGTPSTFLASVFSGHLQNRTGGISVHRD